MSATTTVPAFSPNQYERIEPLCARYARQLLAALPYVDASAEEKAALVALLRVPKAVHTATSSAVTRKGDFVVATGSRVHTWNFGLSPAGAPLFFRYGGGARALIGGTPWLSLALAQRMDEKFGLFGIPVAGAKFYTPTDLNQFGDSQIRRLLSGFMEPLAGIAGPGLDVWAGDRNISGQRLEYLQEGYVRGAIAIGKTDPGLAVAGLPYADTANGRNESTGYFLVEALRLALVHDGVPMGPHIRVALHGFGQVGRQAAARAVQLGWTVVAAVDEFDGFVSSGGINVQSAVDYANQTGSLNAYVADGHTEWMHPQDVWALSGLTALLVCSNEDVITETEADQIEAQYVAPAANMAATAAGEAAMERRGITYLGEAFGSGGGAIVSFLGALQQSRGEVWPTAVVLEKMYRYCLEADTAIRTIRKERGITSNSLAATVIGLDRKMEAYRRHFS